MKDFTQGSIARPLVEFTVPMLLANLLQALYNVINGVWIGHLLGHRALAAMSVSGPVLFLLVSTAIGLAIATTILAGQSRGSGNMSYLARLLSNSFMATSVLCVVISASGIALAHPLLRMVNTPPEIEHDAHTYFVVMLVGMLFNFVFNWFSGMLRGLGDARTPLLLLVGSIALNILLVPLLIRGVGPFPGLGIAGAGIGTVSANFLALIAAYAYVLRRHPVVGLKAWDFTLDRAILGKLLAIGIPASLQLVAISVAALLVMSLVNRYGADVTAAYGIGLQIDSLAILPGMAVGMSVSTMVAQNLGAGRHDRVRLFLGWSLGVATAISAICFLVVFAFPHWVAHAFTSDEIVLAHTQRYLRTVSWSYFTFAWMLVLQGIVRGAGDTLVMLAVTLVANVAVRYPVAVLLADNLGLRENGIWIAIVGSSLVGLLLNYAYYASGWWRRRVMVSAPSDRPKGLSEAGA